MNEQPPAEPDPVWSYIKILNSQLGALRRLVYALIGALVITELALVTIIILATFYDI